MKIEGRYLSTAIRAISDCTRPRRHGGDPKRGRFREDGGWDTESVATEMSDDPSARANRKRSILAKFHRSLTDVRLVGADRLVKRLETANSWRGVGELHNEICVAASLLDKAGITSLEYEPSLRGSLQTIDFRLTTESEETHWIDVKTIDPAPRDRWDQFQSAKQAGRFGPVNVIHKKEWLGGELFHGNFAARSRILEYTLEFEWKIETANLTQIPRTGGCLVFCGNGFHWHLTDLKAWLEFYFKGTHAPYDSFATMEQHYIATKRIDLDRTVPSFGYLERNSMALLPSSKDANSPSGALKEALTFLRPQMPQ